MKINEGTLGIAFLVLLNNGLKTVCSPSKMTNRTVEDPGRECTV